MMDQQHGRWIISCDDCDETFDTEKKDREEAEQEAINNGWTFRGSFPSRVHYCEQCTQDHEDE